MMTFSFLLIIACSVVVEGRERVAAIEKKIGGEISANVKNDDDNFDMVSELEKVKEGLDHSLGKIDGNFKKLGDVGNKLGEAMKHLSDRVQEMIHVEKKDADAHDRVLAEVLRSTAVLLRFKLPEARPDTTEKERDNLSKIYLILTNLLLNDVNIEGLETISRIVWMENQKYVEKHRRMPDPGIHEEKEEKEKEKEEIVEESPLSNVPRGIGFKDFVSGIFKPVVNLFSPFFGKKTKEQERKELISEILQKYNKVVRMYPQIEEGQEDFRRDVRLFSLEQLEDVRKALDEFYLEDQYDADFYDTEEDFDYYF